MKHHTVPYSIGGWTQLGPDHEINGENIFLITSAAGLSSNLDAMPEDFLYMQEAPNFMNGSQHVVNLNHWDIEAVKASKAVDWLLNEYQKCGLQKQGITSKAEFFSVWREKRTWDKREWQTEPLPLP